MPEIEKQPAQNIWRHLKITSAEADRAIASIEERMEKVDEIVEEQLKAALDNRFRFGSIGLRDLESDPETASELQTLRQKLVVSYLEKFAARIRALRSLISEQVQA